MKGSRKSIILKTTAICAAAGVAVAAAVVIPVVLLQKNDADKGVLTYGDVQVSTNGSTTTLKGANGQVIKNGDNDAMFLTSEGAIFGSNLSAELSYTVTNPSFTPKKGTSSYYIRAKLVYYGVNNGTLEEVNPDDYFEVKPQFSTSWLESKDGYFYNVNPGEGTWASSNNISKLHINTANDEGVYLFNNNPSYTVKEVSIEYDILAVEVKVEAVKSDGQTDATMKELGWNFQNLLVEDLRLIFDVQDGSVVATKEGNTEEDVVELANYTTTREGYTFGGWSLTAGGDPVTSVTFDKEDITVHALWDINSYNLIYNLNEGQGNIPSTSHEYGSTVTLTDVEPTREGYTFGGWALGNQAVTSVTFGAGNIEVTAIWNINSYDLIYDLDEGTADLPVTQHEYGSTVTLTDIVPTREGYTFDGWSLGGQKVTSVTFGAANITVTARWIKDLTLVYDLGDELVVDEGVYHVGSQVNLTNVPTKEGYTFDHWTLNDQTVTSVTFESEAGIVVRAVWKKNLYVIYGLNGGIGSVQDPTIYFEGDTFTFIADEPTRENYTFAGWSFDGVNVIDETEYDFTFSSNENIVLNAVWEYYPTSGVRIHEDEDGYIEEDYQYIEGRNENENDKYQLTIDLPEDTRNEDGYRLRFAVDSADGELLDANATTFTAQGAVIDLYPVWEKATSATFIVEGADSGNGTTTSYSFYGVGNSINFPNPYADGKVLYWEDEDGNFYYPSQQNYIRITKDNYKTDMTFTARWSTSVSVTYSVNDCTTGETAIAATFKLPTRQMASVVISGSVVGWRVEGGDDTVYQPGQSLPLQGDTTFIAVTDSTFSFNYGDSSYAGNTNTGYKPVVTVSGEQLVMPENTFGVTTYSRSDNYGDYSSTSYSGSAYFKGWQRNDETDVLYQPGQLVDYESGDTFTAQYGIRRMIIDLDGGTMTMSSSNTSTWSARAVGINNDNSSTNFSLNTSVVDKKVANGKTYKIGGWTIDSQDAEEDLYVELREYGRNIYVITVDGSPIKSNEIVLKPYWVELGTYTIEFDTGDEDVTIIDKATGEAPVITYTVNESNKDNVNGIFYNFLTSDVKIAVTDKEGYLPVFSLKTKNGNVIYYDDVHSWRELTNLNLMGTPETLLAVPGGLVCKVEWEKAYDIEIRKGTIEYIDEETGETVNVEIPGEIIHLKHSKHNFIQDMIIDAGFGYSVEGWMPTLSMSGDGFDVYSVATGEKLNSSAMQQAFNGDVYCQVNWVNIGLDLGSVIINGEEVKAELTKPVAALYQEGTQNGSIGIVSFDTFGDLYRLLFGDTFARIPGHPEYRVAGYECNGEVVTSSFGFWNYLILSGDKTNGKVLTSKLRTMSMSQDKYYQVYEDGELVEERKYNTSTGGTIYVADENQASGYSTISATKLYYNENGNEVVFAYLYNDQYYLIEDLEVSGYVQTLDLTGGVNYTEDQDHSGWYYWEVEGGRVYATSTDASSTHYFLATGGNFDTDKVQLGRTDLGYSLVSSNSYKWTMGEGDNAVVVGYTTYSSSYSAYEKFFESLSDDLTKPIIEPEGIDSYQQTLDFENGINYTEDTDHSGWYYWTVEGGRVYSQSYDNYAGTRYFLADGDDFDNDKVQLTRTELEYGSLIPSNYAYKWTMQVEDEEVVVGYTTDYYDNNTRQKFFTSTVDDLTRPNFDIGEGISNNAWQNDVPGNTITLVWERTYEIADGEGADYMAKYEEYSQILDIAQDKVDETLMPGLYNDLSNLTVSGSGELWSQLGFASGEYSYTDFMEAISHQGDFAEMILNPRVYMNDLDGIQSFDDLAKLKAQYIEDENLILLQRPVSGDGATGNAVFVLKLDENGHLVEYSLFENVSYYGIYEMNMGMTIHFNGVVYYENPEMTNEITEEDAEFTDVLDTLESDTFYALTGNELTPIDELSNDLVGQYVKLKEDTEFTYTYTSLWFSSSVEVTDIDVENQKVTIKRKNNGFNFYATIDASAIINANDGVSTIDDIVIGNTYNLNSYFDAVATTTIGKYKAVYVQSVDTTSETLTLTAQVQGSSSTYTFTYEATLDDIDGILTPPENDIAAYVIKGAIEDDNYMQEVDDEIPSDLSLPSTLLTDEDFISREMTIYSSEDGFEYRVHFEGFKAQEDEITISEVDIDEQTITLYNEGQGMSAVVGLDAVVGIDTISADLIGQSVVLARDVEFVASRQIPGTQFNSLPFPMTIVSVDTEEQTADFEFTLTMGGRSMKYTFTASLDNLDGLEEFTEDMIGTSGYVFTSEMIDFTGYMAFPANTIVADYVFVYNEDGELVKYRMDKYEAGQHTAGLGIVLIQSDDEEEQQVEP